MTPPRWCERHPTFTRLYMPLVVTATFVAQVWEVVHR